MHRVVDRFTGAVALVAKVSPDSSYELDEVRVHLSAAGGAGSLIIQIDSGEDAAYDTVLLTQDMTAVTDLVWQPTRPIKLAKGDEISLAWANANGRTYGIEVIRSEY